MVMGKGRCASRTGMSTPLALPAPAKALVEASSAMTPPAWPGALLAPRGGVMLSVVLSGGGGRRKRALLPLELSRSAVGVLDASSLLDGCGGGGGDGERRASGEGGGWRAGA